MSFAILFDKRASKSRLYHGNGHLEKIYENALLHRLRKQQIAVQQQVPLLVRDEDGTVLGEYFADMIVEGELLLELKACRALAPEHSAQVIGYLKSCRLQHALLINFGGSKFEVKKFVL